MNDLKFAFRQLLKNPGFTAVAVLTLASVLGQHGHFQRGSCAGDSIAAVERRNRAVSYRLGLAQNSGSRFPPLIHGNIPPSENNVRQICWESRIR
jgi:hypothetical protein